MDISKIKTVAEDVVREIGQRMRDTIDSGGPTGVSTKGRADFVTEVDIWAESRIAAVVAENFPEHLLIGEETSASLRAETGKSLDELGAKGVCWVVDPIDGTANFVNSIPLSVVSIGVLAQGRQVYGIVYDPARDELFHAEAGYGAYLNDKKISVSSKSELAESVIGTGFPHDRVERWDRYREVHEALMLTAGKVRMLGATALELCWLACGRLDGFLEYHPQPWDVAGATIIAREAGACVESFVDKPGADYSVFSKSVIAANKDVLAELLKAIR
jgi:myo-inositol-1(or 4)-monophosphatase